MLEIIYKFVESYEKVVFEIKTLPVIGKRMSLVLDSESVDIVFDEYKRLVAGTN